MGGGGTGPRIERSRAEQNGRWRLPDGNFHHIPRADDIADRRFVSQGLGKEAAFLTGNQTAGHLFGHIDHLNGRIGW